MRDTQDRFDAARDREIGHEAATGAGFELFDFYVAQLEAYLDGELTAEEAIAVRHRLIQEEPYAAALGRLHAQRAQRAEVFAQIERSEVDEAAAGRIVASARQMAQRGRLAPAPMPAAHSWPLWVKVLGGMAACILVGFGVGLIGTYNLGKPPALAQPTPYEATTGSSGFNGWVRYVDGEPMLELPAEERPFRNPTEPEPDPTLSAPPY